jgi:hypothetical protein
MPSAPARIAPWKKAVFALCATAAVLGACELGLRGAGWGPAYRAEFAGWRMPADLDQHLMQPQAEPHRFFVSTDAEGLRTTLPEPKPEGVLRIAVLGDSTVFGWGVGDEDTLPARLQVHLRSAGSTRVEVLNAAQPGYTTAQLVALYEDTLHRWKPDLLVLFVPQHDHTPALVSDWEHYEGSGSPLAWTRVLLARHSRIYHLLWTRLGQRQGPDTPDGEMLQGPSVVRVPRVSDDEREAAVARLQAGVAPWGGRVALGLMPFYPDLSHTPDDPGGDGPHVPWHRSHAAEADLPLLDVRHCCGPDADAMVFPFDQWHLSARGNNDVAKALATQLVDAGLVPVSR